MKLFVLKACILLSLIEGATPEKDFHRKNSTGHSIISKGCSLAIGIHKAHCFRSGTHLICGRGFTIHWLTNVWHEIRHLRIMDWPGTCFNVDDLQYHFPNLHVLDFINCTRLTIFKGRFRSTSKIEKLEMHGLTSLWEVPADMVTEMPHLKLIDLRYNTLRHLRATLLRGPQNLERVYLGDNKWDCSDGGLDWLAMENENSTIRKIIVDYYQLVCHQQLYRGKPLYKVMDIIKMVRETCPEPCTCAMTYVVNDRTSNGGLFPLITVDCAKKNLVTPPITLPPNTTTLRLEGNKISSIRSLVHDPQYIKMVDLYLDNNTIQVVKELEGSEWFTTFRVLSLRGNLLKQIPVYAFDKAFQVNNNIMGVYLGHNPWRCDCHFIPRFQGLLLKYKRVIRDLPDIKCSKSDDKTISQVQISKLSLGNVCSKTEIRMPISTINIVNLVLTVLILLVIGRFLYDWHQFRTTGKLPWISSILP